jgi:hypothetical protein
MKIKQYSIQAIDQFTRHTLHDTAAFNWLMNNGCNELPITLDAIRDDKRAFKYLMDNKFFILAAFANAIWDDEKAFKFLMDAKAFEWAACANIINGDDKAEDFLKRIKKENYVLLAHAIQMRIHEDGDRNVGPIGALKNMLNFKKAFQKAKDEDN